MSAQPSDSMCHLCGLPVGSSNISQPVSGRTAHFCCLGCLYVFQILYNSPEGIPGDYRNTGLYRACVSAGLIPSGEPENKSGAAPQPPSAGRVSPAPMPVGVPDSRAIEEGLSQELSLKIEGMWCVACSWLIEQLLRKMDGVLSAGIFFFSDIARIKYMPHLRPAPSHHGEHLPAGLQGLSGRILPRFGPEQGPGRPAGGLRYSQHEHYDDLICALGRLFRGNRTRGSGLFFIHALGDCLPRCLLWGLADPAQGFLGHPAQDRHNGHADRDRRSLGLSLQRYGNAAGKPSRVFRYRLDARHARFARQIYRNARKRKDLRDDHRAFPRSEREGANRAWRQGDLDGAGQGVHVAIFSWYFPASACRLTDALFPDRPFSTNP